MRLLTVPTFRWLVVLLLLGMVSMLSLLRL